MLRPGGKVFLQVPLLQAVTAPPAGPEYHGDNTLVFWRFGWDLTDRVRKAGFRCTVLVPEDLRSRVAGRQFDWPYTGLDVDVPSVLRGVDPPSWWPSSTSEPRAGTASSPASCS